MNPLLPYVTKIKFKGKSTKILYACMVHGKGLGFFYRGKGRVMHIAMHVKSTKKKGTIYRRFLFGPSVIVRLFPHRFFHGPAVVNDRARFLGGSFLGHR